MAASIINGREVSQKHCARLRAQVQELAKQRVVPGLAVILVGNHQAAMTYVKQKTIACNELGFYSEQHNLAESTTQQELIALIHQLNKNDSIHGILIQLPLPPHIEETAVIEAIYPRKDVDAFHKVNAGSILVGDYQFIPCTAASVLELIHSTGVPLDGKHAVVIGRSNIVGKPVAMLLLHHNTTVTIAHSHTQHLADITRQADVLVSSIGQRNFVTADMVKPGAIVIDVSINRDEAGNLCGDVDFDAVKEVAGYITPVPGGVGPMTITMLLENTIKAAHIALEHEHYS